MLATCSLLKSFPGSMLAGWLVSMVGWWQCPLAVVLDDPVNPLGVVPDLGVHAGEVWVSTADAPRDDALKVSVADERPS